MTSLREQVEQLLGHVSALGDDYARLAEYYRRIANELGDVTVGEIALDAVQALEQPLQAAERFPALASQRSKQSGSMVECHRRAVASLDWGGLGERPSGYSRGPAGGRAEKRLVGRRRVGGWPRAEPERGRGCPIVHVDAVRVE